jgi:anti-anti-sigma regulatory factor
MGESAWPGIMAGQRSTTALQFLRLASLKRQKENHRYLVLAALQPFVKDIFQVIGLEKIFSIHSDLKDAIDDLRPNLRI